MEIIRLPGFNNILITKQCEREFQALYKRGNPEKKNYQKWFDNKMRLLDTNNNINSLISRSKDFEKIAIGEKGFSLYSLRRPHHEGNPRVLFSQLTIYQNQPYILLLSFNELNKSDYTTSIPVASGRMKSILKEINGEDE